MSARDPAPPPPRAPRPGRACDDRPSREAARARAAGTARAWAEISLDAIRDNVRALLGAAPGARLLAVVKADAYGHGAVEVARVAVASGAWGLGVATVEEGVELRRAGLASPVLILGPAPPEHLETAVGHDLAITAFRLDTAQAASRAAARAGREARLHLKVDTGMGRIGAAPEDAVALAQAIRALPRVALEGCFTHLATADEPDLAPARSQLATFRALLRALEAAGVGPLVRHAANSAATLRLPEARFDLVRCGIALYGIAPAAHLRGVRLRPAMRLCARVAHTKRVAAGTPIGYGWAYRAPRATTIATIPVGYADGYPRLAGGSGGVAVGGRRVPIAGRVSMDQITVDAGEVPVAVGDEVELWGAAIGVEEVAAAAQTISYEVLARVPRRVPRVFLDGGRVRAVRTLLGTIPGVPG